MMLKIDRINIFKKCISIYGFLKKYLKNHRDCKQEYLVTHFNITEKV